MSAILNFNSKTTKKIISKVFSIIVGTQRKKETSQKVNS